MQEQYVAPELKLVGRTDEVVLGSTSVGFDLFGQRMPHGMEFETDDGPTTITR